MDDDLEDLAYDRRLSKAGAIRRILALAIAEADAHRAPNGHLQIRGGAL